MNKYIIPVCDLITANIWLHKVIARSQSECIDKCIQYFIEKYDIECDINSYKELQNILNNQFDIALGDISDLELLW